MMAHHLSEINNKYFYLRERTSTENEEKTCYLRYTDI